MRRRWIWDKAEQRMVEISPDAVIPTRYAAGVIGDVQPYRSMVTGEIITGRRQHREHLKRHRLVEIGNDYNNHTQKRTDVDRPGTDIKRALEQHGYGD